MRTFLSLFTYGILVLTLLFTGCSKGDSGSVSYVPDLSAQWTNKADATNTFFFFGYTTGVNTSSFNGNENPPGGGSQFSFTGSFTNHNVQFTYNAGTGKTGTYTGTINDSSTVITLNSAQLGSLVLEKK